jgi:Ca2+/H+ antiporter, TMEM165/GDT1 family
MLWLSLHFSLILSTFAIIFVAELPDKTALASLILATRFRVIDVILGAWLAFLVHVIISVTAGGLLHFLPEKPIHLAAGIGFLVLAVLALRRNDSDEFEKGLEEQKGARHFAWVTSFLVVFAAEWGDLTQFATAALAARTGQPLAVALGAIPALWAVAVLAATLGAQAGRFLTPTVLNRVSAVMFGLIGAVIVITALV